MAFKKFKEEKVRKVHSGDFVNDLLIENFIDNEKFNFYFLDSNGVHIKDLREKIKTILDSCFIFEDYDGVNKTLRRKLKKIVLE
ncbi:MAG: hypothetical protein ACMXYB_05100 [Candidatus Woesearchaeota archaeon]